MKGSTAGEDPDAEEDRELQFYRIERRTELIKTAITSGSKWGCIAFGAWCALLSIESLAGRKTSADISLNTSVSVGPNPYLLAACLMSLVFGIACWSALSRQRKLFEEQRARFEKQIRRLQSKIDPGRSSSELSTDVHEVQNEE